MKWIRKSLILAHRYLGIVLGLLFLVWFISGIGMMYAGGMPGMTAELRLMKLPAIDFSRIRLTPLEAAARVNSGQEQTQEERSPVQSEPSASAGQREANVQPEGRGGARESRAGGKGTATQGQRTDSNRGRGGPAQARGGPAPAAQAEAAGEARGGGRGGRGGGVGRVVVSAILDRPVYRLGGGRGGATIVYADDGAVLKAVDSGMAKTIAAQFMNIPEEKLHYSLQAQVDQWTIGQRRQLPLHKFSVDDADRTELYMSPQSGDIVVLSTRGSRALAWVAAIPHWLYFTPLRVNDRLWTRVIIWTSGVGCFLALFGIALGITQFRYSWPLRVSRLSSHIPYSGLMRWHYIAGVVFGVFTLTWVFSGLLSMDPWEWVSGKDLRVARDAFTGGALELTQFPPFDPSAWSQLAAGRPIKEIEFTRIQGDPYYLVRTPDAERMLVAANPLQARRELFSVESLMERLKKAVPDAHIVDSQLLTDYDSYYYSQDEQRPLPILRAKFDDPKETWVYIDPAVGQVAGQLHRGDRIQRWLYHGLHSLDFSFWYRSRGTWEAGMIVLSLGGAIVSGIGLWLGIKRMVRAVR